jgi:hypothetical protein
VRVAKATGRTQGAAAVPVPAPQIHIEYTKNFATNLQDLEQFWLECNFIAGYDRALDTLLFTIVPSLERHQNLGKPFSQSPDESSQLAQYFGDAKQGQVRELVFSDYVLLYQIPPLTDTKKQIVYLLAIKHQRQLSFNFHQHWDGAQQPKLPLVNIPEQN